MLHGLAKKADINQGTLESKYGPISAQFELLCSRLASLESMNPEERELERMEMFRSLFGSSICAICEQPLEEAVESPCKHRFCHECILERLEAEEMSCPVCLSPLDRRQLEAADVQEDHQIVDQVIRRLRRQATHVYSRSADMPAQSLMPAFASVPVGDVSRNLFPLFNQENPQNAGLSSQLDVCIDSQSAGILTQRNGRNNSQNSAHSQSNADTSSQTNVGIKNDLENIDSDNVIPVPALPVSLLADTSLTQGNLRNMSSNFAELLHHYDRVILPESSQQADNNARNDDNSSANRNSITSNEELSCLAVDPNGERRRPPHMSTKIAVLVDSIKRMRVEDGSRKCLVFSQFTQCLDLIENTMRDDVLLSKSFVRFDGKTSVEQRKLNINQFKSHHGTFVFLISLRAGGVGLNLVEATRGLYF